ncbi:MAG: hypothetical protein H7066_11075 [Cytophagaceae bacterium]|nr:hypothetical protein [Gemmatimonadaceae bacterium]
MAVLAVLASVATILQLFRPEAKGTDLQLASDLASSARPPVVEGTAKCTEAAGRWDWLTTGGVVTVAAGGTLMFHRLATDALPMLNGTWECDARDHRRYTFRWIQTGLTDTVRLSENGQLMTGANVMTGFKLSATRAR